MRKFALFLIVCAAAVLAHGQGIMHGNGTPTSLNPQPNCGFSRFYIDDSTQKLWMAAAGSPCVWIDPSSTGAAAPSVTVSTSGPVTVTTAGYYFNNAAGALTFTLKTLASGDVGNTWCFRNSTTKTGAITLTAPASTTIDLLGVNGSAAGTLVSAGAAGDSVCVTAISTTQYMAYVGAGTWTNN